LSEQPKVPWRLQKLAAARKPLREEVGMERVRALQDQPVEDHAIPYGSQSQHTRSRSCPCRPKVRQVAWWKVEVEHFVIEPEEQGVSGEAWDDLRWMESRRQP
jgi:hypothetical protein